MNEFKIGQRVRALIDMDNDLRDDGLGLQRCANKGDILIVRGISPGIINSVHVSHEEVLNNAFCAAPSELELVEENFKEN